MAKLVDAAGRPHSGVVPYPVVALVVDNVDPDKLGRIKVKFPTLHEEPQSYWLRQVTPNASKEFGMYAIPEIGDEVLVMFINGDQSVGVVVGQLWNGEDKPPKEAEGGLDSESRTLNEGDWSSDGYTAGSGDGAANDRRFWRSRSGHLIGFDDTDGSETIQIWDKSGALALVMDSAEGRIILANDKGDVHIRTSKNLFFEAGGDAKFKVGKNYTFEAGKEVKIKAGMDYTLDVGMAAKMKAKMDMSLEGLNFKAKGKMAAKIEGGMTLLAKGGMKAEFAGGINAKLSAAIVQIN